MAINYLYISQPPYCNFNTCTLHSHTLPYLSLSHHLLKKLTTLMGNSDNLHVAMLCSPGMGHLIPILVLGNRLAADHNVIVTVFLVTTAAAPPESKLLNLPLAKNVEIVELPPVDISTLVDPSAQVVTKLFAMVRASLPYLRSSIAAMNRRPDALIVDHFGTDAHPIASEFQMARYVYAPSNAWFSALTVYCPVLDKEISGQFLDQNEDLKIPGAKQVRPVDAVDPMLDRNDQQYYDYLRMAKEIPLYDGLLVNSWEDLEPTTLKALRDNEKLSSVLKIPVYPIGPLTRPVEPLNAKTELFDWLDRQPNGSVMFVSFGSGGVLSAEQIIELAWGLELSQQRFLWVIRSPTRGHEDEAFFGVAISIGISGFLPDGFLTRTRDVGLVVPKWAEQAKILGHPCIGGFLSHCGWNSSLESITNGVPMIAWPLYAEQRMNAALLAEELGVAIRPTVLPMKGVIGRDEIEKMVRMVMEEKEGMEMREKVKQLKSSGEEAHCENGSSYKALCDLVSAIVAHKYSREMIG